MRRFRLVLTAFLVVGALLSGISIYKKYTRPDLTIMGYINLADGLGRQGPELLEAFKNELKINFKLTRKLSGVSVPKYLRKKISKKKKNWGKVIVFEDLLWDPWNRNMIRKLERSPSSSIRIAYSMWESTQIPAEWVDILNNHFDAVAVPSPFLIDVYQQSGVCIPIFEVPLAVDIRNFCSAPLKEKRSSPMVFANFSAGSDRKNHVLLIRAFHKAFGDDPSVQLRINARYCEKEVRNAITKELAQINARNIHFLEKTLRKKEYLKAFQEIDCYVSPSKGEGFSIQPREAMAMGIPVIVTNNTGQIPICESGLTLGVDTPIKQLALNPWGDFYGLNFTCTEDDLAKAMLEMRQDYDTFLKRGEEARRWASQYLYENLKPFYANLISPKKVVLGPVNEITCDRLVTNSIELFRKYKSLFGKEICQVSNEQIFTSIYSEGRMGG